jgi:branched-chain amino acid transport system substrate-binding protein
MHKQRNILMTTLWVAVSLLLIFAVTIPLAKQAEAKEVYKVGAIFAVTGRASFLGEPEKKTAEMIVEEVNKRGGINGHPLELVIYDDAGQGLCGHWSIYQRDITGDR